MNYARDQAGTSLQAGAVQLAEGRLQVEARETAVFVDDIGGRLIRVLNRLRVGPPVPIENDKVGAANTLEMALARTREAAERAHHLLAEIEGLV